MFVVTGEAVRRSRSGELRSRLVRFMFNTGKERASSDVMNTWCTATLWGRGVATHAEGAPALSRGRPPGDCRS